METIKAYDNSVAAVNCYNSNLCPVAAVADLGLWRDLDIPRSDGILAGPPCQDASPAASRLKQHRDKGRSSLYLETAYLIADKKPQWAIVENVLDMRRRREYAAALAVLVNAGYWIAVHQMKHADYGGVTTRDRMFVVASKRMLPMPAPIYSRRSWRAHGPVLAQNLAEKSPTGWNGWNLEKARVHEYLGDATFSKHWGSSGPTYRRWEEPYFTVTATSARRLRSRWGGEVYTLDVDDLGLLQGLPRGYKGLTDTLVGNAVPPEMARTWGRVILSAFGTNQQIVSLFCGAGGFDFIQDVAA